VEIVCQVASTLAGLNHLIKSQLELECIKMQNQLIDDILSHLDKFEKTGDWFHFSLALDALDDLKKEIENN